VYEFLCIGPTLAWYFVTVKMKLFLQIWLHQVANRVALVLTFDSRTFIIHNIFLIVLFMLKQLQNY